MDKDVPYIAYEATIARFERTVKRLTIAVIVCVMTIFLTNLAWLMFFSQYEYSSDTTETVTIDGKDGNANFVRNGGVINNGEDRSSDGSQTADAEEEPQE